MTSIDPERFREALLDERRRVEHALATLRDEHRGSLDEEVEEIGASDNHLAETATATLGREIDYTLGENSGQVLAAIDAALKRIDEGTYGTCASSTAEACLKVDDIDPPKDAGVGRLAEAPPPGESEQIEEISATLSSVIDDGLVAGHAREHGDDGQGGSAESGCRLPRAPRGSCIPSSSSIKEEGGIHTVVSM